MALADITLADGQASPVNHVFTYVATQGARVIRAELAAPPEQPQTFVMAHSEATRKGVKVKSHLARFDLTVLDSDGVTPHEVNIRVMADIPNAVLSDALVDNLSAFVRNWLSSANTRAWARGSVG